MNVTVSVLSAQSIVRPLTITCCHDNQSHKGPEPFAELQHADLKKEDCVCREWVFHEIS